MSESPTQLQSDFFGSQLEDSDLVKKISNKKHAGPFLIGRALGAGISGTVRIGIHAQTGFKVALKIVLKKYLNKNPERWSVLRREIAVMKVTDHPNIVKLYDVFETKQTIILVTELLTGGELFDYIPNQGLSRYEALRMLAQMTSALLHCHEFGIVHRDLKPENLLLDDLHNIKIGDFGMARLMKDGNMLKTSCGSPHYASPEVIAEGKYDGKCSDVWSLGVIVFAMVTGSLPFDHNHIPTLLGMVKKGVYTMPTSLDGDIKDLIGQMIQVDLSKRIKMEQILQHSAFQKSGIDTSIYYPRSSESNGTSVGPSISSSSHHESQQEIKSERLDRSIVDDILSLGWDSKEELIEKILHSEASLEKSLYHHLKQRRSNRIEELRRLSPLRPISNNRFGRRSTLFNPTTNLSSSPPRLVMLPPTLSALVTPHRKTRASSIRSPDKNHFSTPFSRSTPYSPSPIKSIPSPTSQQSSQITLTCETNSQLEKPHSARMLFQTPSPSLGSSGTDSRESSPSTSSPHEGLSIAMAPSSPTSSEQPEPSPTSSPGSSSPITRWFAAFLRRRPSQDIWSFTGTLSTTAGSISPPSSTLSPSFSSASPSPCHIRDRSSSLPGVTPLLIPKNDHHYTASLPITQKKKESSPSSRVNCGTRRDDDRMVCDDD